MIHGPSFTDPNDEAKLLLWSLEIPLGEPAMLPSIAPSGISDAALGLVRAALDLAIAIKRKDRARDPHEGVDWVHQGLLSAAFKLGSPTPEVLEEAPEREGLLKLLTLAEDMGREEARLARAPVDRSERPDIELADLRRRTRISPLEGREAVPKHDPSRPSMPRKEAS